MDYFSRIYAECRGGLLPVAPRVLMCNDSTIDPNRAPANKAVMKVIALNVPYEIKGDSAGKNAMAQLKALGEEIIDPVCASAIHPTDRPGELLLSTLSMTAAPKPFGVFQQLVARETRQKWTRFSALHFRLRQSVAAKDPETVHRAGTKGTGPCFRPTVGEKGR